MKTLHSALFLFLIFSALTGCFIAEAERDNPNDPGSDGYSLSAEVYPAALSTVAGHEDIVIKFTDRMDPSSVVLGGDIIVANTNFATADAWIKTVFENDTLTIKLKDLNTKAFWPKGTGKILTVNGKTAEGMAIPEISVTYDVVYRVYVRASDGDDVANTGTPAKPVKSIAKGIALAGVIYAGSASDVYVAEGTYYTSWVFNSNRIIMAEGVSLYGGFSKIDWTQRDIVNNETVIEDQSEGGGTLNSPNSAVYIGSAVTSATVIDGFTILMGKGTTGDEANSAVYCEGSPVISNNKLYGRSSAGEAGHYSIALYIKSSAPQVKNNTIDARWNEDDGTGDISFGIYSYGSSAIIENNTINGGMGRNTYGIFIWIDTATAVKLRNNIIYAGAGSNNTASYGIWNQNSNKTEIINNTIDCGSGSTTSRCISISGGSPVIVNNILINIAGNNISFGIYENGVNPGSVKNNDIYILPSTAYYYNDGVSVTNLNISVTTEDGTQTLSYWNNKTDNPQFVSSTNLHLTSASPDSVKTGGMDCSAAYGFSYDKDGAARTGNGTTGWSIGAYEQDN